MSMGDELRGMLMTFRVSELQMLLGFASQNKTGRKSELQARALALLKNKSVPQITQIHSKIRELYKTIQQGTAAAEVQSNPLLGASGQRSGPAGGGGLPPSNASSVQPPVSTASLLAPPQQPLSNTFMSLSSRQNMYGSMYAYQQAKMSSVGPVASPYQPQPAVIHPDVKFKRLPFYDILAELVKPSTLAGCISNSTNARGQESSFIFYLSPQQATEVSSAREVGLGRCEYPVQVQLRFCLLETSCEQDDIFPPGIAVKVNGKQATLPNPIPTNRPGVEAKRPPRPVNISSHVKLCPFVANHITVSWNPDYTRGYVLVVHLVRKLSAHDLLNRLKTKGIRNADCTKGLIKEKLSESDSEVEIATTSLRVSLLCPLGKMKMDFPVKSTLCSHLQCFDASLYLQMNEKRPTWTCPVCDKQIPFDTLVIDGYFLEVLKSPKMIGGQQEVQLLKDGSWTCSVATKEESTKKSNCKVETDKEIVEEILDDGDDEVNPVNSLNKDDKQEKAQKKMIEIDLTCSDSDNESSAPSTSVTASIPSTNICNSISSSKRGTNSTDILSSGGGHMESPIIMLDSPSPPSSPVPTLSASTCPTSPPPYRPPNSYPQIVQSAGQNSDRPLVMTVRIPSDHGRYHPY